MSISIAIFGSAHRTVPGPLISAQKRTAHSLKGHSIKYAVVAAGISLFGLLSPANAASQLKALDSPSGVSAASHAVGDRPDLRSSRSEQDCARDLTSHLPWLAPVGHRQPRPADIPADKPPASAARAQERLNTQLDQKLIICRC
jgi:hypothetical protein